MRFDILTLFPDIVHSYGSESILKRAQKAGLIKIAAHNFRDYTKDKQRHVDDKPYGGGAGMVLQVQPIYDCLKAIGALKHENIKTLKHKIKKLKIENCKLKIIALDPAGKKFDQPMAEKLSKLDRVVLICGRYEGFDERIYKLADEKVSVGNYVLSGGELPALVIVEAVSRLLPGVLGNQESLKNETFSIKSEIRNPKSPPATASPQASRAGETNSKSQIQNHKLEFRVSSLEFPGRCPVYTRPENFMGKKVPKVLLSGNHKKIEEWRNRQIKNYKP